MTTITQKRKLSKSAWVLIIILFVAIIAVAVLAFMGILDLSPISNGYLGVFMWASQDIVNGLLTGVGFVFLGVAIYWVTIKYFIGNKVTTSTMPGMGYNPLPSTPSQSQKDSETVIS